MNSPSSGRIQPDDCTFVDQFIARMSALFSPIEARRGLMPALKAARTAFTWPRVSATADASSCRRSDEFSIVVD
jgi:hypothetical protein